jgi:DNA-binding Lrp family transcriptional regulator
MIVMDIYDKKILFALDTNARTSYVQLAKQVHLSKDAIKNRINNYVKEKLIDGFYPLINSAKLGYYSFRVYFSFKNASIENEQEVIDYLIKEKNIFYLIQVEGYFDVGFGLFAKTIFEFNQFITSFKDKFSFIEIQQENIFIQLHHFDRNYLINSKRKQNAKSVLQEPNLEKLDEVDIQLLSLLSKDARMPIVNIAEKLNLTSKAIIYRLKNLEKKEIILGYKPKINLDKLGYSMYKIDLYLNDNLVKQKIKAFIYNLPNIIHAEEVFGGSDLEFDVECKDYTEFEIIINLIKKSFGKNILAIKHYRTTKILKTIYLPC